MELIDALIKLGITDSRDLAARAINSRHVSIEGRTIESTSYPIEYGQQITYLNRNYRLKNQVCKNHQITVSELEEMLSKLPNKDAKIDLEGCDCIGECIGIEINDSHILLLRID